MELPGEVACDTVSVMPLSEGTAAQIVRFGTLFEIVVSARIPIGERMAVVSHVREAHPGGCRAAKCARARAWLTPVSEIQAQAVG